MANFSSISIIDSINREVFINPLKLFPVDYEEGVVPSYCRMSFFTDDDVREIKNGILVNGEPMEINTGRNYVINEGTDSKDYFFLVYARELTDLDVSYKMEVRYEQKNVTNTFYGKICFTKKSVSNNMDLFDKAGVCLTDTNSSFQLARTNPKLSGNIKLVVTSEQNLFLDTFKVSDNLSKYAYRHKSVSAMSLYSTDVRNIFKSLDSKDLYKVPDDDLKAHTPFNEYEKQYQTLYEYGAETNDDELYDDNFRILAPLWLNRNLPDFFVVFRIDNPYNVESYINVVNDTELFEHFLKNGKVVKVFDMRESSPVGMYLRSYYNKINQYPGSVLLQFKEQETGNDYNNGINSWFGISVDTGLVVKKDEVSYFANEIINKGVQDKLNQFIVDGFERNRLLCPNLINLEFMFNDEDVPNYRMSRYFGLYFKENDIVTYDYVEQKIDSATNNYVIKKFDENHNEINDTFISGQDSILNNTAYDDRMFFAIGTRNFERLKEPNDLNSFLRKEITSKPYKNYQICKAEKKSTSYKNFVSISFLKQIQYGEHFRIVIPSFGSEGIETPVVFEFIASNDKRLEKEVDGVSPFISISNSKDTLGEYVYYRQRIDTPDTTNTVPSQEYYYRGINTKDYQEKYTQFPVMNVVNARMESSGREFKVKCKSLAEFFEQTMTSVDSANSSKYAHVFRLNFYTQDISDSEHLADLGTQIHRLEQSINAVVKEFGIKLGIGARNNDSLSILSGYDNTYFQHITNTILDNDYVIRSPRKVDLMREVNNIEPLDSSWQTRFENLYVDEIVDTEIGKDETIVYYGNKNLDIPLVLLDNKSDWYSSKSMMFAPVNFEILGWRTSSIVSFLTLEGYSYEIESDDISKLIPNTIVRSSEGRYKRLNDYEVKSLRFNYADRYEKTSEYEEFYQDRLKFLDEEIAKIKVEYDNEKKLNNRAEVLAKIQSYMDVYNVEKVNILAFKDRLYKMSGDDKISHYYVTTRLNRVQSPFNLDKYVINSDLDIAFDGDCVSLYSSQPAKVSLMGMLPIKDFDTTVGYSETEQVTSSNVKVFEGNTNVYIDNMDNPNSIRKNIFYTLSSGKFKDLPLSAGSSFIIIGNTLYYNSGTRNNYLKTKELKTDYLITADTKTSTKISVTPYKVAIDYLKKSPVLTEKYYYKNDDVLEDLNYSLVSPTVCNWKGVGGYYDHDSVLRIDNILYPDYKYVSKGYLCMTDINSISGNNNMFLDRSIDSLVDLGKEKQDFFTYITTTSVTDSINLFLTDKKMPEYTVGYYNKYINTLDFILYGVKFSIKFNSSQYVSAIQLSNYNKYEIYLVNDFNGHKNDVIINTIENTILIINHNFNFGKFDQKRNTVYARNGKLWINEKYNWTDTDKYLHINTAECDGNSIFIPVSTETSISSNVSCEKFVQMNMFDQQENEYENIDKNSLFFLDVSVFREEDLVSYYTDNNENRLMFNNGGYLIAEELDIDNSGISLTDKFLKYPVTNKYLNNYTDGGDDDADFVMRKTLFGFGTSVVSDRKSWLLNPDYAEKGYLDSEKLTNSTQFDLMIEDFVKSFKEDGMIFYVKNLMDSSTSLIKIETSPSFKPMSIDFTLPEKVKYCVDFYNPNFRDLVVFEINETSDLIGQSSTSFILSNTRFKKILPIRKYYGFKVFDGLSHNLSNTTNMFVLDSKSLVASNWDYQYYRNYTTDKKYTSVDGFVTGIEDKSFFGSKGIKLRNITIEVEEWNENEMTVISDNVSEFSTSNSSETIGNRMKISINLHRTFFNHFMKTDDKNFLDNWNTFNINNETPVNNFVKKSLVNYFKINNRNNFRLFAAEKGSDDKETILMKRPSNFDRDFKEVRNFKSSYRKENNEVIMEIVLTDLTKVYYATYDFKSNL